MRYKVRGIYAKHKSEQKFQRYSFVDLFGKCPEAKANFLSLYNAIHGTNLTLSESKIEPIMLEQTVYRGLYNDVSMLLDGKIIVLVEQQSTVNENMPLRFLEYISRIYEKLISKDERYKMRMISLPKPEFYVFYNGIADYPAEKTLKLSDAFFIQDKNHQKSENYVLELSVKVYNMNKKKDNSFIEKCSSLSGYSKIVEYDRKAKKAGIEDHLDFAIQRCIKEGILSDYLIKNSTEVRNMLIAEYDYDTDIRVQRQESFEEGAAKQKAEDEKLILALKEEIERLKSKK